MGIRSFIRSRFGKPVETNECSDYDGIVQVGDDFYDPPDAAFIDSTLRDQPPFHPISFRTKEQ